MRGRISANGTRRCPCLSHHEVCRRRVGGHFPVGVCLVRVCEFRLGHFLVNVSGAHRYGHVFRIDSAGRAGFVVTRPTIWPRNCVLSPLAAAEVGGRRNRREAGDKTQRTFPANFAISKKACTKCRRFSFVHIIRTTPSCAF